MAAWRQPRPAARLARVLWIVWAVIVWNVVFDRVIVVAGRSYIAAAGRAAAAGSFANMDDWMRPAAVRGFWIATASGALVLFIGLAAARSAEAFALRGSAEAFARRGSAEAFALRDRDQTR